MIKPAGRPDDDPRNTPVRLRGELLAEGYDDYGIARLVADGTLVRVRRGAYVAKADHDRLDVSGRHALRARAAVKQAKTDVVLSHVSGLPEYDAPIWRIDLDEVHLTRLDGKVGRREAGVRQHRGRVLPGDIVTRNGVRVMSGTRTALETTTLVGVEPALCVVNHLLHHGHTTLEQLAERYRSMDHWPNTLSTDIVLRLADPRIETVGESRCFYLFSRHGIPAPVPQYEVHDEDGELIGRVDFAWPDLGVFLEFDGKVKYEKPFKPGQTPSEVVIAEKRREDRIRRRTGWRCIRLTWDDLEHPERTVAMLRREVGPTRLPAAG
ncbi:MULTISPECIES: type IV toxin-antitoxin system AbiEi family antitoxin domain-containing protein [unclassified Nocardioides]|uniref:type IV toxin-antitoxin system AbiEi family antitoxin domain-containing protein n=1 Tax=unclassified Nocardioides TaxID=2615069 RepID=UPI000AF11AD7|nr:MULTISPECIES: type IV toxin-antitoxin system AbiEi family antitoxin domain-containing protein [unclassified Nocardioides]